MSLMMIQNQAGREREDEELEMCSLELNSQYEGNWVQQMMMQTMVATLMTHSTPISNFAQNNQNSVAIQYHISINIDLGIGISEELSDGKHNVNAAGNRNADNSDEDLG